MSLAIDGLVKRFGPVTALAGLSLEIPEGHVFGFLGSNGAGKTTTMRIALGVLRADEGISKAAVDMSNFREGEVTQVTFDGKVYGLPEFFNVVTIVINNKIATEAGVDPTTLDMSNWDAIKTANEKMLKKGGGKI